ncbi:MAG: hypothetical protein QF498_03095 [Arenicellales bacterium]|nr:hypothetical protein [Arenicellales bacterium]
MDHHRVAMGVGRQMLTLLAITVALGNKGDGLDTAVVSGNLRLSTVVGRLKVGRETALGKKLR